MKRSVMALALAGSLFAASAASARVTLTYWEKWTGFEGEIIKDIVEAYNKKQNRIFVKMTIVGWDVEQKFLTSAAAGNPPDVVGLWNHRLAPFVSNGLVEPLDQYLKVMNLSKKDFIPSYWDMMSFKGKLYGAPITPSAFAFYWNKGLFAESGLNPEVPPKTMEEIMIFNEKLTRRDANGRYKQIGYTPHNPGWWPYLWPVFFGGDVYNEAKNTVNLSDPAMHKGYEWIANVSKRLGLNDLNKMGLGDYRSKQGPFFSQKMAMDIQGSWQPSFVQKYVPNLKYGITNLPYGQGGEEWAWLEADVLFMPKGGKRNKYAAEFIKYMLSPEVQKQFNIKRETFSPIKAALTPDFLKANKNPDIRDLVEMATNKRGRYAPQTPAWADLDSKVYGPIFWDVWNQKKAPAQALNDMQKIANQIVQRKGAMKK